MATTPPVPPSPLPPATRWPVVRRPLPAYLSAVAVTCLALLIRFALDPVLGNSSRLVLFMLAAAISAFLFGQGPGIVSTIIGTTMGWYFFVYPRNSFHVASVQLELSLVVAVVQGVIISFCAGSLHRALRIQSTSEREARNLYQAEIRAHAATAENNRTKDYFLAVLSHELRGPLTAIQYCVADRLSDPSVPRELRDDFALIERSARMQARLISDLLDLTRLTRGKMEIEVHPLNLHHLLVEAVRTSCSPDEANGSPIPSLNLQASQTWVLGDRDRLLQVFWNILRNAAKFTPRDGSIEVESYQPTPDRIAIRIRDTGIGLTPEALSRIFNPFEQASQNSNSKKHGGLGLGLAIAAGIIEMHDGTLTGTSAGPNQGTAFTIELPVINPAAPTTSSLRSAVGRPTRSGTASSSTSTV